MNGAWSKRLASGVFLLSASAAAAPICGEQGTSMYFGNGVNVTSIVADEQARDILPGLADEAGLDDVKSYAVAYNQTNGLFFDLIEVMEQKAAEDSRFTWFVMNNIVAYSLRGASIPTALLDGLPGGDQFVTLVHDTIERGLEQESGHSEAFYDADVADHVAAYAADLEAGDRVMVMAHSQGNLYANAARRQLLRVAPGQFGGFGIDAVATPAEYASDGYTTSDTDLIIGAIRELGNTVLPSNVHVPLFAGDFLGHYFEETYCNAQLPARSRVVSLLAALNDTLSYPEPPYCESGVNSFSFSVEDGQGVQLRVVDLSAGPLRPRARVFHQDGTTFGLSASSEDVSTDMFTANRTELLTVVVEDAAGGVVHPGDYKLYVAVAGHANEGGELTSDRIVTGHLDEGDLDSYTINLTEGQALVLRMTDLDRSALVPGLYIYDPDGAAWDTAPVDHAETVAAANFVAPASGTYTVIVYDISPSRAQTGDYELAIATAPGANQGGELVSGAVVQGTIAVGRLESYTFMATKDETWTLRVSNLTGGELVPEFWIYRPSGAPWDRGSGEAVATATMKAPATGLYTIILYDNSVSHTATGDYELSLTQGL